MANSSTNNTRNLMVFLFIVLELVAAASPVDSLPVDLHLAYNFEPANFTIENYPVPKVETDPRRQLAPFQLCLPCKCCAASSPTPVCMSMPCCFGIDCQIPNKPFGFCAFVPKTCNCTSCAV